MTDQTLQYTGERLVPGDKRLRQLLVEDLAKFQFAGRYTAGKWVLDAGCGAGQGSTYLAGHGAAYVVGVDISPEATALAAKPFDPEQPGIWLNGRHPAWVSLRFIRYGHIH